MQATMPSPSPEQKILSGQYSKKLLGHLGVIISLVIVSLALRVLYDTLQDIDPADVVRHFRELPMASIMLAFGLTAASYLLVTGYDYVALRHIHRPLPYTQSAFAAFLASTFGNNIGFAIVTGTSVRYRLYSQAGLSALEIAGVSTMCAMNTMIGMAFVFAVGTAFQSEQIAASSFLSIPLELKRLIGGAILAAMAAYVITAAIHPMTIRTRNWSFPLPSGRLAAAQIVLASTNLSVVGTLIYVLLPADTPVGFIEFLGVFSLAIIAGSASNVPGGIGVFESVMLLGLPEMAPAALLGSILLFRCIYYLTPLGVAALMLGVHEGLQQRGRIKEVHSLANEWLGEIGPLVMAMIMLIAGTTLLFSEAVPVSAESARLLEGFVPLPAAELAHLAAAAAGVGLFLTARGLSRRLEDAYRMTVNLLIVGIVAALLKGFEFTVALILGAILAILLTTRPEFPRRGSILDQGFPAEWASTLFAILAVTVWIGMFAYKGVSHYNEMWFQFGYEADYPNFIRSASLAAALTAWFVFFNLFRTDPEPDLPHAPEFERVIAIIKAHPDTRANLALLGDKRLFFSESKNAFIMFQTQGKSWIALGDPVGPREEFEGLIWQFRELCNRYGGWPAFYLVDADTLPFYRAMGLSGIHIGNDARVPLTDFSLDGVVKWELRNVHKRVQREGASFEMIMSSQVAALLPELKRVSDAWLMRMHVTEKGFSRGYFDPAYVTQLPCAVVRKAGRIVAFATLWASSSKEELALDLMRYDEHAPKGVFDYMLAELMEGGKAQGYRWFNLGLSPLPQVESDFLAPIWKQFGVLIYRQSEHFQNLESLRGYQEKFAPVWRPKYFAAPGKVNIARILRDLGRLAAKDIHVAPRADEGVPAAGGAGARLGAFQQT